MVNSVQMATFVLSGPLGDESPKCDEFRYADNVHFLYSLPSKARTWNLEIFARSLLDSRCDTHVSENIFRCAKQNKFLKIKQSTIDLIVDSS